MIILSFYYYSDHFPSSFPIFSLEELNFAAGGGLKLYFNRLKSLEKPKTAEFGTPFA